MSTLRPAQLLGAILLLLAFAVPAPARASPSPGPVVVVASTANWYGFTRYWRSFANRADRVVLIVALVGIAALFIITRGKWLK